MFFFILFYASRKKGIFLCVVKLHPLKSLPCQNVRPVRLCKSLSYALSCLQFASLQIANRAGTGSYDVNYGKGCIMLVLIPLCNVFKCKQPLVGFFFVLCQDWTYSTSIDEAGTRLNSIIACQQSHSIGL